MLKHVDIFSGIGGFPLGFHWARLSEPSMFCEIDPWCRKVLGKHWPTVPITNDVKELANDPEKLVPDCDIITGGYPCQPFSVAGKQKAHEDDRHLWPYLYQIIACKRPAYAVLENVSGHIGLGLDTVLLDLEAEGYATRTFVVPACSVNAPHRRDRLWIIAKNVGNPSSSRLNRFDRRRTGEESENRCTDVAYSNSKGLEGWKEARDSEGQGQTYNEQSTRCSDRTTVAYSNSERLQGAKQFGTSNEGHQASHSITQPPEVDGNQWAVEPNVGRVAHGIPRRVDRIRGLGNAIVPQIAMQIGLTIKEMELCKKKV